MRVHEEDHWLGDKSYVPSAIVDLFRFPASGLILEVGCGEDTFLIGSSGLVFQNLSVRSFWFITPGDDWHTQGIEGIALPSWDKS